MVKRVALIKGDGVGPELVDAMLKVLRASGTDVELVVCDAGLEWWQQHGGDSMIPPETWEVLKTSNACFKGPTTTSPEPGTPRSVAVTIRQYFNLYANVRPIKTLPRAVGPLGEVDFLCVREATEGLYSGIEYNLTPDVAIAIRKITRQGCERVMRFAFREAKKRGWEKVIAVTKRNILKLTDTLFIEEGKRMSQEYGITMEEYFIDNFAQQLVKNPQRFNKNVIVSTNLFMDILSEEASGLIGSIGCVYSANMGDDYAMFEPAHGSAPRYKGMDKVNPTATILSGAWMLEYLGDLERSKAIFDATYETIAEGKYITYDLGGSARTSEMAEAVAKRVEQKLKR